jgi:GTPase SAR1 family protein
VKPLPRGGDSWKMPEILKMLVMGLPKSGKTTFIKYVFGNEEFKEFEEYKPTFGVNISLYEFKGLEGIMVSAFDCGGQTSFIDTYMTDQWVPTLFGKVSLFLFLVDSSSKDILEEAVKLFHKYHENVKMNSPDAYTYVLATKWDKHSILKDEIKTAFKDIQVCPISILDGSALDIAKDVIDNALTRKEK